MMQTITQTERPKAVLKVMEVNGAKSIQTACLQLSDLPRLDLYYLFWNHTVIPWKAILNTVGKL